MHLSLTQLWKFTHCFEGSEYLKMFAPIAGILGRMETAGPRGIQEQSGTEILIRVNTLQYVNSNV